MSLASVASYANGVRGKRPILRQTLRRLIGLRFPRESGGPGHAAYATSPATIRAGSSGPS